MTGGPLWALHAVEPVGAYGLVASRHEGVCDCTPADMYVNGAFRAVVHDTTCPVTVTLVDGVAEKGAA